MSSQPIPAAASNAADNDAWIGRTIADEFEIVRRLGAGNQGTVYLAHQKPFDRPVAVKLLQGKAFDAPMTRARFMREAQVLGLLTDAASVRMVRFGCIEPEGAQPGALYLVQELAPGRSLREVLEAEGPLEPERAVNIALQVLGALADAHRHGVVHRDLKPPHILLHTDARGVERVKVIDFGLAHLGAEVQDGPDLTMRGWAVGSPRYMAPEILRGEQTTGAVDQYALGNILFEMLTGRPPFKGGTMKVLRAHVRGAVPTVPARVDPTGALARVVNRAMAKVPEARYLDATEMADELEAALIDIEDDDATLVDTPSVEMQANLAALWACTADLHATASAAPADASSPAGPAFGADITAAPAMPAVEAARPRWGRLLMGALSGAMVVFGSAALAAATVL